MAITTYRNEIGYAFVTRATTEDILLPELSQGVFLKPLRKFIADQPTESGLAVCPINDDDFLGREFIQERRRLRGDDDLLENRSSGCPNGLAEKIAKKR
jgi:hypothetical protein